MRVQNRWTKGIGTGVGLVLLLASAAGFGEPPSNAQLDTLGTMPVYSTQRLSILSDQYGPRPAGSTLLEAAFDWAYRSLKDDGLTQVQRQTVPIQGFIGGTGTLTRTGDGTPTQGVPVLPLGGTTGTPPEGVEGPLLCVSSLDELELTPREQIRGAIVLLNQPMENREDLSPLEAYQRAVKARLKGPALAALRGAKGWWCAPSRRHRWELSTGGLPSLPVPPPGHSGRIHYPRGGGSPHSSRPGWNRSGAATGPCGSSRAHHEPKHHGRNSGPGAAGGDHPHRCSSGYLAPRGWKCRQRMRCCHGHGCDADDQPLAPAPPQNHSSGAFHR